METIIRIERRDEPEICETRTAFACDEDIILQAQSEVKTWPEKKREYILV